MNPMKSLRLLSSLLSRAGLLACCLFGVARLPAQTSASGTIEGRVFNAATGLALANARVTVEGAGRDVLTDETGTFHATGVAPGAAQVTVSYVGFAPQTFVARVPASGAVQHDVELALAGEATGSTGQVVQLAAFNVVSSREMSAQAIAMNEQRTAANMKTVVAYDEYGERGNEHIGEFLRFIPGVALNDSGLVANEIILRGFPSEHTQISVDGGQIAGARGGNTRSISVLEIPTASISRVEVNKLPTPDLPAAGLGGSLNVISKNGFESRKPVFNYSAYMLFNSHDAGVFGGGPRGHVPGTSPKIKEPSFAFDYLRPVSRNFAFTVGATRTWRQLPITGADETPTWNLVNLFQRQSQWQNLDQVLKTVSGQLGSDWRLGPRDVISVKASYRKASSYITRNVLTVNFGTGATGGETFTQGAATGVGTVTMNSGSDDELVNTSKLFTAKYTHRGDTWHLDAFGSFSHAEFAQENLRNGHFATVGATIPNLVLRGEGIGEGGATIPRRYSAATRTGAAVDILNGANYTVNTFGANDPDYDTYRGTGTLDATREFRAPLPWKLKAGFAVDRLERYRVQRAYSWAFRPNGLSTPAALLAGGYDLFDQEFNRETQPVFGARGNWISKYKAFQLYQQHPDWFVFDEANYYQNYATNLMRLVETVSAGYVRTDVRLLDNRLHLIAGVRYENTTDSGYGPRNDPSAQYQKDARGNLLDANPAQAGLQPVFLTNDPLARAQLRFTPQGTQVRRSYADFYPSVNASYEITDSLLLRAAYARTIGRPNVNFITPGSTFSEPTVAQPTITVNNPSLRPWTADNFDLAIEAYNVKGATASVGVFRKNIRDFFGSVRTDVTPALLEQYGIADDPAYTGYELVTMANAGDAKITGVELNYRQSLTFLPAWAKGFQVFFNASRMRLSGSAAAEFDGFNPSNYSAGINFVRPRYFIKLSGTFQGETRRSLAGVSAANGIPANTYTYQDARRRFSLAVQYSLSKQLSLFGTINDLDGGFNPRSLRYAPGTPGYAKISRHQELGSTITVGVKGTF